MTIYDDALECECFITDGYCTCEEGCECGCPECVDCDSELQTLIGGGCACGGNCMCNQSEEIEGGDSYESDENY